MEDRDTVIEFTRGLMDRLRERANLFRMDQRIRWEVRGSEWIYDADRFSATVTPVKMIHFGTMFRVTAHDGKISEIIGTFDSFDIAQDVAESFVSSLMRGAEVLIGKANDVYGRQGA